MMAITLAQYAGIHSTNPDWTLVRTQNAVNLLTAVNSLLDMLVGLGVPMPINPATKSQISGQTFGGFRPECCQQGAPNSSHKDAKGIDLFDPHEDIDDAITDAMLTMFGLYREAPSATKGWCHLTTRAPKSGHRSFLP